MKNSSKKITNKRSNKKRFSKYSHYKSRGGRQGPPKWKIYGYRSEDDYIQDQEEQLRRERLRRERLERELQKVLNNPIIQSIMMIIMNNDQAERFQTHIRENIRIEDNVQSYNQMIREFINQALELLNHQQIVVTRRIMNAIRKESAERTRMNQPYGHPEMLDTIERVLRGNMDELVRNDSSGGSGGGYYKRFTRKNKNSSNRRK